MQYLEAWLRGNGCVPLYNLMEDAATAEISRAQVWQWIRHGATLDDGRRVDAELVAHGDGRRDEADRSGSWDPNGSGPAASPRRAQLFERLATQAQLDEFLTLPAYEHSRRHGRRATDGAHSPGNDRR